MRNWVFNLFLVIILTGCSSVPVNSVIENTPTTTPSITVTPTVSPTPTPTVTPEVFTAEDIPVSLPGEGIPSDLKVISADNVDRLEQIAVYGPGTYGHNYFWSPSQKLFAVSREAGFELFDLVSGQSLGSVASFHQSTLLGFTSEDTILLKLEKRLGTYLAIYNIPQKEYVSIIGYQDTLVKPANQVKMSDDKRIAADDESGKVGIWDLSTGNKQNIIDVGMENWLYWLSTNGDKFATLGQDNKTVTLWSSLDGKKIASFILDQVYFTDDPENHQISFSILQDGQIILAQNDNLIKAWSLLDGKQISAFDIGEDFKSFTFSNNGKIMGTTKEQKVFNFWDIQTGMKLSSIDAGYVKPDCWNKYIFSSDSSKFITFKYRNEHKYCGYDDTLIIVWNVSDGSKFASFAIKSDPLYSESLTGKYIIPAVSGVKPGLLTFGNLQDGSYHVVDYVERANEVVIVSPDDSHVAVFSYNPTGENQLVTGYTLKLGDLNTGDLRKVTIPKDWYRINGMKFSPDGTTIAVSSFDEYKNEGLELCTGVAFWDMNGNLVNNVCFSDGLFDDLQFSTDSQYLMLFHNNTCQDNKEQKTLRLNNGEFSGNTDGIEWVYSMSSDGCFPLEIESLTAGDYVLKWGQTWSLGLASFNVDISNQLGDGKSNLPAFSKSGEIVFFGQKDPKGYKVKLAWMDLNYSSIPTHVITPELVFDRHVFVSWMGDEQYADFSRRVSLNNMMMSPDGKVLATINRGTVILWGVRK